MALKRWAIADFDDRTNLVDGTSDWWTQVGSTAEYTYNQAGITAKPRKVYIDGALADEGTVTSLAAGEWGWNAGLFVRITGDGDPDAQASGYIEAVQAETTLELMTAAAAMETFLFSLMLSNYSATDPANITVEITDGTNNLFEFNVTIPQGNSPMAIDSSIVLEPSDVISVTSDIDEVSVLASGDES